MGRRSSRCQQERKQEQKWRKFPTEPVTSEAHPYPPTSESEEDVSRPTFSSEPRHSGAGSLYLEV
ncbi:hypothetical protein Taro_015848 [Colocasia esculenta]|uniref:Uncharacterized protein n=1 Tax=Colocasia esculenta TaxID=4460 RepID=A0A843UCD4_COLES|nr:hypothetical protein [Colocasia esculenta]